MMLRHDVESTLNQGCLDNVFMILYCLFLLTELYTKQLPQKAVIISVQTKAVIPEMTISFFFQQAEPP